MNIGVVSDTHGHMDPLLEERLAGVEAILHCGDVGSREVLERLGRIAKVYAVRGNVDGAELELPPSCSLTFEGVRIEMLHALPVPQTEIAKWSDGSMLGRTHPERRDAFLKTFADGTRVVLFGHSHEPFLVTVGHVLFFNPGSAGPKRFTLPRSFGLLEVFARGVRASVVSLERHNEKLPPKVWMPVGG